MLKVKQHGSSNDSLRMEQWKISRLVSEWSFKAVIVEKKDRICTIMTFSIFGYWGRIDISLSRSRESLSYCHVYLTSRIF